MKVNRAIVEMLERPVDVKKLVDRLYFNADDLETAALKQPKLYLESGRFRAQTSLEAKRLARKLAKEIGIRSLKIRQRSNIKTEGAVKSQLSKSHTIQSLQKRVDDSEVYEEFAKQLTEAYKERLMVLALLSRLKASEISSEIRKVKNAETVDAMRKRAHNVRKHFKELSNDDEDFI
jgi:Fe2+ transport system protein B